MNHQCRCRGRENTCDEHLAEDPDLRCSRPITQEDLLCDQCRKQGCVVYPSCLTCKWRSEVVA